MLYKCLISTNVEIPNNFSKCDLNVFDFHSNMASVGLGVDHVIISDFFFYTFYLIQSLTQISFYQISLFFRGHVIAILRNSRENFHFSLFRS